MYRFPVRHITLFTNNNPARKAQNYFYIRNFPLPLTLI
ncbi:hypothetical protein MMC2321_00251 [Chitinophaga sp. MM2321]